MTPAELLRAYDEQLRVDAEAIGTSSAIRSGPLLLATFGGSQGFVSHRDLGDADVAELVREALRPFEADPAIKEVEWKTRGHDRAPGLHEALVAAGFVAGEPESIMIGEAAALAIDVQLADGVTVRQISSEADVRAMAAMQDEVFGDRASGRMADDLLRRISAGDDFELWVAEAEGGIISAGRLEPVPGTDFAGIWGGATLKEWRGRGIYRALTAARARSALTRGKTLIHSDSTQFSRPILERSGLIKVSTTTPYLWSRNDG